MYKINYYFKMKRKFNQISQSIKRTISTRHVVLAKRRRITSFSIKNIIKTSQFKSMKRKMNQEEFYRSNGSDKNLLKIVKQSNKAFGEKLQSIIKEMLDLDDSEDAGHDAQLLDLDLKFEIKSSRYGVTSKDFMWQHIMEEHDYDYLILVGVDFKGLKVYVISKYDFMNLKKKGIATQQGRAEGQGLWVTRKKILSHLTEITTKKQFYNLIENEDCDLE